MSKKSLHILMLTSIISIISISSFSCNDIIKEDEMLTITCTSEDYYNINTLGKIFAKENNIIIKYNILDNNTMKYKLNHNGVESDLILFDSIIDVNNFKDILVDITTNDYVSNYNHYYNNYFKSNDDRIYVFPSPGKIYSYVLNDDLIKELNVSKPSTLEELKEFSSRIKDYTIPFLSGEYGNDVYLDLFMQVSVPLFFGYIEGFQFFENYVKGNLTISNSIYTSTIKNTLNEMYSLCNNGFFNGYVNGKDNFNKFKNGQSILYSLNEKTVFNKDNNLNFEYSLFPFLGETNRDTWICAQPDFYLSMLKDSYSKRRDLLDKFTDFYTSVKGQKLMMKGRSEMYQENGISFINDIEINTYGSYLQLEKYIAKGKVFIADKFKAVFKMSNDTIKKYINGDNSIEETILGMDSNFASYLNNKNNIYIVEDFFDLDSDLKTRKENILKKISSRLKDITKCDLFLLDYDFLKQDVLDFKLYQNELEIVFNVDSCVYPQNIKGSVLKEYIDKNMTSDFNDKVYVNGINYVNGGYVLNDGSSIRDDKDYFVMLPSRYLNEDSSASKDIKTYNLYKLYVDTLTNIVLGE